MSEFIFLGEFETNGDLLVTDPCYEKGTWCTGELKVKPGVYKAYLKECFVKDWGDRVKALYIVHQDETLSNLGFTKTSIHVGVDSGQAGFFNKEMFMVNLEEEVPLIGKEYHFRRQEVDTIDMGDSYGNYLKAIKRLMSSESSSEEDIEIFLSKEKDRLRVDKEKRLQEALFKLNNINPANCEKSKDFDKVCCSLTFGKLQAGVEKFGVVSSSGFGDGGYCCYVSEKDGAIAASYIEFITDEEILGSC